MTEQEIIEGNRRIAEFMGAKIGNGGTKKYPVFTGVPVTHSGQTQTWTFAIRDLRYHTSWDWLMPVVEKIENLCNPFSDTCMFDEHEWSELSINSNYVSIETAGYKNNQHISFHMREDLGLNDKSLEVKTKALWVVVIQFIHWYQTQTPTK